jgi:hypothetical protein
LPELESENALIYEVYYRVFGSIENIDVFKVMDLIGIKPADQLHCLDMIQAARNEVLRIKLAKGKNG